MLIQTRNRVCSFFKPQTWVQKKKSGFANPSNLKQFTLACSNIAEQKFLKTTGYFPWVSGYFSMGVIGASTED